MSTPRTGRASASAFAPVTRDNATYACPSAKLPEHDTVAASRDMPWDLWIVTA